MKKLHLDFEVFSPVSIDAGDYFTHPETVVTTVAWAFGNDPVTSLTWPQTKSLPPEVFKHLVEGGILCAHNAAFEHAVFHKHYGLWVPLTQLDCTMERALVCGLPPSLLGAGKALNLAVLKDESQRGLMLMMAKPRPGNKGLPPWHEVNPQRLAMLAAYCEQDVEAERALDGALLPLSEFERSVSLLTARSNIKGFLIDVAAVKALRKVAHVIKAKLNLEITTLTGGAVTDAARQVPALKRWLASKGFAVSDLSKEKITTILAGHGDIREDVHRALEIRQLSGKTSLAKLEKMLECIGADGRVHGQIQYYGANRTGRWAGRMIQPQNLPKPHAKGFDAVQALEVIMREGEVPEIVYDKPLTVIASCLRPCIVAKPGHVLLSIDLSQIEARVLAWLAGQQDVVDAFANNLDVYIMAAQKLGSPDRQLGKVMTLACGFGMGKDGVKFQATAKEQYGLELTLGKAAEAVEGYRATNPKIVRFWYDLEQAFEDALKSPGLVIAVGRVKVRYENSILRLRKPNGGVLYYHRPSRQEGLAYWGVVKEAGGWAEIRTYGGKLVENVTQAVARDVMAEAIVRIERDLLLVPVMTVHDEAVYEVPEADNTWYIQGVFDAVPNWAVDLPVASETKTGKRFSK